MTNLIIICCGKRNRSRGDEFIDTINIRSCNQILTPHHPRLRTFPDRTMKWNKHVGGRLFSAIKVEIVFEGSDEEEEEDAYDYQTKLPPNTL